MAYVKILPERCKSCLFCVHYCPKGILDVGEALNSMGYRYVAMKKPEQCVGCAVCAMMCPDCAIEVYKEGD